MKVRDFIKQEIDIDVYDNVCEEIGIAFCGSLELTEVGESEFADVLEYDIEIYPECAVVDIDDEEEEVWECRLKRAKKFFNAAAGYCSDENYKKWFVEPDASTEIESDVMEHLKEAFTSDYADTIAKNILNDVVENVMETSAFESEGSWNDNDIRYSIARVIIDKLGLQYN